MLKDDGPRYVTIGKSTYHLMPRHAPHGPRTACGMILFDSDDPRHGFFDEPPADRRPCERCQDTVAWRRRFQS